ncbi:flagellar basal body rod protein FlgB [Bacillus niameyensis]|uniref:flagellar basal body rod protein FlgB n=1 Tax=Bacillus niameyensis TaxID=1522308 RepID=UPI000782CCAB|nr:flagellar basal body rod protein FlgB [Bacillus niameyensis]
MELFSNTIRSLENGLNYSAVKHKVIAQNIANVDVPNYKSKGVEFRQVLEDANKTLNLNRTDSRHLDLNTSNSTPKIFTKQNLQYQDNGNNVDVDQEMSDLAQNQIYYQALIERLNGNFSSLSNVIKGGR